MKNYCLAAISTVAIALGLVPVATATEANSVTHSIGLDFSLASEKNDASAPKPIDDGLADETQVTPLAVPAQAPAAPLGSESKPADTAKLPPPPEAVGVDVPVVEGHSVAANSETVQTPATVPSSQGSPQANLQTSPQAVPVAQTRLPLRGTAAQSPKPATSPSSVHTPSHSTVDSGILSFEQAPSPALTQASRETALASSGLSASLQAFSELETLFQGNTNSLVARAVGSAEGTRTPDGGKTRAYRGHVDPGNGVWNLGTFSYQHGAQSPEEADQRQLRRLRNQALELRQAAQSKGLQLTLEEELNGIDLANQSPRAALSRGGYIDRLHQAREMGLAGTEAVLWARTRSYLDPDSGRWNAPGLGNNVYSITQDQDRRLRAIARAISAKAQSGVLSGSAPVTATSSTVVTASSFQVEANTDLILSLDLSP